MKRTYIYRILAVVFALLCWEAASLIVANKMLLSSPFDVFLRFFTLIPEKEFRLTLLFSFLRISVGFLSAFVLGTVFAFLAGEVRAAEYLLRPFVTATTAVPVASFIILFLTWVSFNTLTVFITFLITFPIVYTNVLKGRKEAPKELLEVADIYKVPYLRRLVYVYLPSERPYILSAASLSVGMAWKAGVAAEVIGIVTGSIGEKLYNAKVGFENANLLCWTLIIIFISFVSEKIFSFLLKLIFKGVFKR